MALRFIRLLVVLLIVPLACTFPQPNPDDLEKARDYVFVFKDGDFTTSAVKRDLRHEWIEKSVVRGASESGHFIKSHF